MSIEDECVEEYLEVEFSQTPEKLTWLEAPVKLMLSLLEDLMPQVGKTANLKNKKKMFAVISEHLNQTGYCFTPDQVHTKFRSLERRFKKMKLNISLTGRNKVTCPFELELESILGERKSLNPDYVLDSENADGKDGNNLNINEDSGDIDIPSCSNAALEKDVPLCTKPSLKKGIINEILKQRYHRQIVLNYFHFICRKCKSKATNY
uniref:Myb/SANT-like DNA-binding domain-containing protein n=1 Tax=Musca domestica TaxID=7370 RepID=A0A1I8N6B0_MUSDO